MFAERSYPIRIVRLRKERIYRESELQEVIFSYDTDEALIIPNVGVRVLELCDGKHTVEQISKRIAKEYNISSKQAFEDTKEFLNSCINQNIIRLSDREGTSHKLIDIGISIPSLRFKKAIPGAPLSLFWEITYGCNLHCVHCYLNAGSFGGDELTTKVCKRIIDEAEELGIFRIVFGGGEPFMRTDFTEILSYALEKDINCAVATNGLLLREETMRMISQYRNIALQISLDGADATTHDWIRGRKGAFDGALKALKLALDYDINVGVGTVVMKPNFHELEKIANLVNKLGIKTWNIMLLIPIGRATKKLMITPNEYIELTKRIKSIKEKYPTLRIPYTELLKFTLTDANVKNVHEEFQFKGFYGCAAGYLSIGMSPDGYIRPCSYFPPSISRSNISQSSLRDIWIQDPLLNFFRDLRTIKGKCAECPRFGTSCGGGCRAAAYAFYGDLLMPDPYCPLAR